MGLIDKVCCVFPGQGSQYVGMGKELYSNNEDIVKKILHTGNKILGSILGSDITNLVINNPEETLINNPEEKLKETIYSQLTILLYSLACFEVLTKTKGISCLLTLGHSIGEYSALVASKALSLEKALKLVKTRAGLMKKCIPDEKVEEDTSHMAAISTYNSNLTYNNTIKLINKACEVGSSYGGIVEIANKNSKFQTVISGNNNAVIRAVEYLKNRNIKKIIFLPVEGPFHSALMKPAAEEMKKVLEDKVITINKPEIPFIANFTADFAYDPDQIKKLLFNQICGTVEWKQSLETAIKMATEMGFKTFIECGPGDVQTKLLKRNPLYKDITVLGVKDYINQISL